MVFSRWEKAAKRNKDKVESLGQAGYGKFIKIMPFNAI